ncbi:hypothetical protein [Shewanella surugensis]|uniref:Uncharacterized protein n=1 Tax=Shewanella surugensis TaxID=212020 RepID=A0ABT0LG04_9GAMM|nr:hypothetical protein [Shewanella surugensis]MCL1126295.1 hypothetical protein [Shewanella surugensis]
MLLSDYVWWIVSLLVIGLFSLVSFRYRIPLAELALQENELQVKELNDASEVKEVSQAHGFLPYRFSLYKLGVCVFKLNLGELTLEPSCKGRLKLWLIDEFDQSAKGSVKAGKRYWVDGFKIAQTTWKVDGSTKVILSINNTTLFAETSVNIFAFILGRRAPMPVKTGVFGGPPKEPEEEHIANPVV